jgi:hypothetical protein
MSSSWVSAQYPVNAPDTSGSTFGSLSVEFRNAATSKTLIEVLINDVEGMLSGCKGGRL